MPSPPTSQLERLNVLMPALSPTMTEGTLARWLKNKGDVIRTGDVIAEIETDKATMEVEAVDGGIVAEILIKEGSIVQVNEPIMVMISDSAPHIKLIVSDQTKTALSESALNELLVGASGAAQNTSALTDAAKECFKSEASAARKSKGKVVYKPRNITRRVFIVHGHDEAARYVVADFLRRAGFEPIILHERPNKGRTIISKFREEADGVGFAVVLMTPDDEGGKVGGAMGARARQNVIFELGFFIGALGPERVAALVKGHVERPSDFDGVVYIDMDTAGGWRPNLGRELEAAGLKVDWNKVMRL